MIQLQRISRAATAIPSTAYPAVTASCSHGTSPPSQPAEIAWLIAPSWVQLATVATASGITGPGVHMPAKNSIGKYTSMPIPWAVEALVALAAMIIPSANIATAPSTTEAITTPTSRGIGTVNTSAPTTSASTVGARKQATPTD